MKDLDLLKELSNKVSENVDLSKLDRVYNELLFPMFKRIADVQKSNRADISENENRRDVYYLMKELFDGNITLQRLIETQMKPYLEEKGYKVEIWSPSYSVKIYW